MALDANESPGLPEGAATSAGLLSRGTRRAVLLRVLDVLYVAGSLWLSAHLLGSEWYAPHAFAAGIAAATYLCAAERLGLYRSWRAGGLTQEAGQVSWAWATTAAALAVAAYVADATAGIPRETVYAWVLAAPLLLTGSRIVVRLLARRARVKGRDRLRAAIAGGGHMGVRVARTILDQPWMGLSFQGIYDDRRRPRLMAPPGEKIPIVGSLDDLVKQAHAGEVDVIYLALPRRAGELVKALARELSHTRTSVYYVPDLGDVTLLRSHWLTMGAIPTISLFDRPLEDLERFAKRVEDLALGGLFLALAAIPMLLIAVVVKLSSPGPVIFRQPRHGLDGREIVVWKFRTMTVCEDGAEFRQATRGDPRVTGFGQVLRATSLDELPQLINVLQGRMSLVGPRPHPVALNDEHRRSVEGYSLRERIKPGLTGWAQINGYRGETDTIDKMEGRVEHDLAYINDWSLWLDLKIIVLTILRGFVGKGAY